MNMKTNKLFITVLAAAAAVLFCISAGCVADSTEGIDVTNSDGSVTVLSGMPERIVLLNSNAGEILYLLGESDKIIGISQSIANNAEQAKMYQNAEVVGTWNEPDVERLIDLKTDLVLGYATSKPKNAEVLAASGIPVVYIDCTKPATMAEDIKAIGKLTGKTKRADEIAAYYTDVMQEVKLAAESIDAIPRTNYAESYTDFWAQGTDSGMGQLITLTGGKNIFDNTASQKVSAEWIVSESPEIVVKLMNSMENAESAYAQLLTRNGFSEISAVQNGDVWLIRNDVTYGPRSCAAAVALLKMQHAELLPGVTPESVLAEFNEKFGTSFETENLTYPKLS
ncbi:MAG TPA: ABC transporter substrate-binding protein [Methanocorpusculum sp.]|nr:ABC transporter substrate-binding protein [Methanocorpusculum sp.]